MYYMAYCRFGRIAGVQAELLSFHRGTSRMALFTSKRFAKPRACHDNFPHLKGNIRSFFWFQQKHDVEVSYFPAVDLYFSLYEKARGEISGR